MFKPTYVFDKVGEITPDFLAKKHIKGLLLDLDNTLTTHNNPVPPQSSLDWLAKMKAAGIKLMIVSNNHAPRVKPFAEQLELDFVPEGKKPLTFGYTKAIAKLGLNKKKCCGCWRPDIHRCAWLKSERYTLHIRVSNKA